jgi:hypothetical protein
MRFGDIVYQYSKLWLSKPKSLSYSLDIKQRQEKGKYRAFNGDSVATSLEAVINPNPY